MRPTTSTSPSKAASRKAAFKKASTVVYGDDDGVNKFRNEKLDEETAKIQAEFDAILQSGVVGGSKSGVKGLAAKRGFKKSVTVKDVDMDNFYEIMGEFYSSDMRKH